MLSHNVKIVKHNFDVLIHNDEILSHKLYFVLKIWEASKVYYKLQIINLIWKSSLSQNF